jgi:hypothetical protein
MSALAPLVGANRTSISIVERAAHWRPNPEAVAVWRMMEE